jgi:hypothetical protein
VKLEGSLDAFSLLDIFQLLSFTQKTGGLHLVNDGQEGAVFFATGKVTGASAEAARQPLARRLIGSGAVDDAALSAAVDRAAAEQGVGVAKALLDAGSVDADVLREAVSDQVVDGVFDLLRWPAGDFAFVVDEVNPEDVGVALPVESVVADAEARKENWDAVSRVVPSPQAVMSMPVVLPEGPQLSREEWSLLALTDGRRSVAELVDLTGCGHYAVVSILAALVQRGLLEVRAKGAADHDHVGVVLRRQGLLAPLEGSATVEPEPAGSAATATAPAPSNGHGSGSAAGSAAQPRRRSTDQLVTASANGDGQAMLGGAHLPGDVVPPRPEPFLPRRQSDFAEGSPSSGALVQHGGPAAGGVGDVFGSAAMALDPETASLIERDPSVNRSLMLRLIAGVRGL